MKITKVRFLLALAVALTAATSTAADVAKVNGVAIPESRLDAFVKNATAQGQQDTPELRSRVRDELITREIVVQEALKKGLDKNPDVQAQIEFQRQGALINAYLKDYLQANPIPEETLQAEYEKAKASMPSKEYKAHHILVKSEDEAKQIIAQLKKGGNFEKIAAQKSQDPTKTRGGDLGWLSPGPNLAKPFADQLVKLKKGQITDTPVQTQFGWHVIRLDDERTAQAPSFDQVKGQIQQQLQNQQVQKLIADLRAKAKIE